MKSSSSPLDSARWQRLWQLFDRLREVPPEERQALLDDCSDTLLRQTLEELMRADADPAAFLAETTASQPVGSVPNSGSAPTPREIGPYRVLHRIGQGGMGTVYLATRSDDEVRRRVVVKVVRGAIDDQVAKQRLRTERQILAGLEHPNIARLYDAGTTTEQQPYFVMEYVDGLQIDQYCEQNKLSIDDRLRLFEKVCGAVQAAHRNLVVHRDLKPSNILVTAVGEPKLLDFGIAKLLNPDLAAMPLEPTVTWRRALTPHYASPEQLRGKLITTASDLYSLGVLLFELLTGQLPFALADLSMLEIERLVTERGAPRPSAVAVAARRRELAGDLDSIVLKALRPVPGERYGSVQELAADLRRFRQRLPVEARQGTWRYRAGKAIRRHRLALALTALTLAALVAFGITWSWQARRVVEQRDRAQAVLDLLLVVFQANDPALSPEARSEMTVREALERSDPRLDRRLRGQPQLAAAIHQAKGRIYNSLGLRDQALTHMNEAVGILRAISSRERPELADATRDLAQVLRDRNELEPAEQQARQALAMAEQIYGPDQPALVSYLNQLVSVFCYQADYESAAPIASRSVALAAGLPAADAERSFALSNAGIVALAQGHHAEAARWFGESLSLMRAQLGEDSYDLAPVLNNQAVALTRAGEHLRAERIYAELLALAERRVGPDHPNLAPIHNNLGGLQRARGDHLQAVASYRRSLEVLRASGSSPNHQLLVEIRLQASLIALGEIEPAEFRLRQLLAEAVPRLGAEHRIVALGEGVLGEALSLQGHGPAAEELLIRSYRTLLSQSGSSWRSDALERLEAHLKRNGRASEIPQWAALQAD